MNREETQDPAQDVSFDIALLCVSHCLTEAEANAESGSFGQAHRLLHLAETYALQFGYLELLSLVWVYESAVGIFSCGSLPSA